MAHNCNHRGEEHGEYCHFCNWCPACCICQFWLSGDYDAEAAEQERLDEIQRRRDQLGLADDEIMF